MYFHGGDCLNTQRIQDLLLRWYSDHFRALPWRVDPTPYHVWISEIMLQQTRIEAVLPYYQRFIAALPNVASLASVAEDDLLKLWEGLGYYSRARNLQKAARIITERYNGELPQDYDLLLSLPGIGAYTAGAIASIAFNIAVPAVDGNVMRVLSRLHNDNTDVLSTEGKRRFSRLAADLVPPSQAGRFNQALMELGETVCLPNTAPRCAECPLNRECVGYQKGTATRLPTRIKSTRRRIEERRIAMVLTASRPPMVLLHRRPAEGLLAGLWELPNTLSDTAADALDASILAQCECIGDLPESKHLFSHIEWRMTGRLYRSKTLCDIPDNFALVTLAQLHGGYPLPSAFRAYTRLLETLLC